MDDKEKFDQYIREHIIGTIKDLFPRYDVEIGRGDRVMVDGKVIKGFLVHPGRRGYKLTKVHIDAIATAINEDIKRGRFIGLVEESSDFEKYMKDMIESGYMNEDGSPKKCHNCDNEDMEQVNVHKLDMYGPVLEYEMKCKKCGTINGHWSYGNWMP